MVTQFFDTGREYYEYNENACFVAATQESAREFLQFACDISIIRAAFEEFLKPLESKSWVTYIQPPPTESSQPADIVKYLARYLTGGPISDHRLVSYENGQVTFTARTGTTQGGSDEIEKVNLPFRNLSAVGACTFFRTLHQDTRLRWL